jgi:outer membrane protein assembly factor BamB
MDGNTVASPAAARSANELKSIASTTSHRFERTARPPWVRNSVPTMRLTAKLVMMMVVCSISGVIGADWPWIYGPARNGTSDQKGLLRTWPAEGPTVLWTAPVNRGFSGPSVRDSKVYLLDRDEAVGDRLRVFDLSNGKELWSFAYDAPGGFMFPGALSTPTVDGSHVYITGPMGDLHAIDTTTRTPIWRKNIWKDFGGGALPTYAITQNPLLYGDLLIVATQTAQAGVVAYDKLTGEIRWQSMPLAGAAGYVTPSIVKVNGEDHLVMVMASASGRGRTARGGSINGLDPLTGKVLWTYTDWQCHLPVPQAVDAGEGRVLISAAYGSGTVMIKVLKKSDGSYDVTELFKNPDFGSHTQPPILYRDHFYAHYTTNDRSDGLVAMSMNGQIKWKTDRQPPFVRGGSILADGLLLTTDGNTKLYLIEPDPSGFKPLSSAVVLEGGDNWAPLALVDGKLLIRGQKELKCVQVAR